MTASNMALKRLLPRWNSRRASDAAFAAALSLKPSPLVGSWSQACASTSAARLPRVASGALRWSFWVSCPTFQVFRRLTFRITQGEAGGGCHLINMFVYVHVRSLSFA